ncbi:hypothetical protein HYN48_00685 [Flavobacterium magnum]|uniref:DUF4468 domain-containing protein n=1 Tax=Flavobacterium magnum TaxID=2162713 RepID=A0A2S0RBT1_9FLAO|nr:hypothetical protein [Flavobacterium magnum]AWA28720.1 hypothetical protein HYN48_00685 [Flavobacterium magnum]
MKKQLCLLLFVISFVASAQKTLNDFEFAIVPVKFDWMSKENQYRVSTIVKMKLNELGFKTYYDTEILPDAVAANRCDKLFVEVERNNSLMTTKLALIFRDCQNAVVFKSVFGSSKKKDFNEAYAEALTRAFESVAALNYKFSGYRQANDAKVPVSDQIKPKENAVGEKPVALQAKTPSTGAAFTTEKTANGYLIIEESSSTVKFRLSKTTDPGIFIAVSQGRQGVLLKKNGTWFFECYENDQLVSEQTNLKL